MIRRWWRKAAGMALTLTAGLGLLALGAPASAQFSDGYRFLEAVKKKDGGAVTDMLNEPGSTIVNARDVTTGETAMHVVVARRDRVWIDFLAQRGANVNAKDGKGVTPLVLAANLGFIEGVEALIGRGARVDEPNNTGETPLIGAVHRRDPALARVLLKAGANADRTDNSGRSARDYALLDGRSNPVLAEIETHGRSRDSKAGATYGPSL